MGAELWATFVERGWVVKKPGVREVILTDKGRESMEKQLGLRLGDDGEEVSS